MAKEKAKRMTNAEFARTDTPFIDACLKVALKRGTEFPPTARQASKWRRKTGLAWESRDRHLKDFMEGH